MSDQEILIQTSPPPKRALLVPIFDRAIQMVESDKNLSPAEKKSLSAVFKAIKGKALDLRLKRNALPTFQAAESAELAERCKLPNLRRALLVPIFDRAVQMVGSDKNLSPAEKKSLSAVFKAIKGKALDLRLKRNALPTFQAAEKQLVIERCGYQKFFVPSITSVANASATNNPASVTQGKEATIVIKGKYLPKQADIKIEILLNKDIDANIKALRIKRVDDNTVEVTIKADPKASITPNRTIRVYDNRYPKQLVAVKADALEVTAGKCGIKQDVIVVSDPNVERGKEKVVTIKLDCSDKKFPANPKVTVDPADNVTVSEVKRVDDKTIEAKITADPKAAEGPRRIIVTVEDPNEKDLKRKQGTLTLPGGLNITTDESQSDLATRIGDFAYTNPATAFQLLYGPIVGNEVLNARLSAGFSSSALSSQRDNLGANFRAAAERSSVLSANINLGDRHHPVPLVGRNNTLANAISGKEYKGFPSWLTVGANMQLGLDYNAKDTVLGTAGIGANLIFSPTPKINIDLFGHYALYGADYDKPNRFFFSGTDSVLTGGAAIGFGLGSLAHLKAYVEYQGSWKTYNKETWGFDFNGIDSAVNAGLQLAVMLNRKYKAVTVPSLWLDANTTVYGQRAVPEYLGDTLIGTRVENTNAWNVLLTAQWLNLPAKPFLGLRAAGLYQQGWDLSQQYQAIAGFDGEKTGRFEARYTYTNNPLLHFGEQMHSVSARYNLPRRILKGALFVEGQYDNLAGEHFFRGLFGLELLKLLPTSK